MRLSDLVGARVRSGSGGSLGRVVDLTIDPGALHPAVRRVAIGRRRRIDGFVEWDERCSGDHDGIQVGDAVAFDSPADQPLRPNELRLVHDVLDTQVVDVAGKRMARVSEVLLAPSAEGLSVVAVDVSGGSVWRRLGLHRLAARIPEQVVDWADLHLISTRGHALQLSSPEARIHRLSPIELAALMAQLPTAKAAEILEAVHPDTAARALNASRPHVGARLLRAVPEATASSVIERMAADDAAELLRALSDAAQSELLPAHGPYERVRRRIRRFRPAARRGAPGDRP